MDPFEWERRRFLKQLLIAAGVARKATALGVIQALAPEFGVTKAFAADPKRRRHLINIVGYGGWEGSWWHNAQERAPFAAAAGSNPAIAVSTSPYSFIAPNGLSATTKLTQYFPDSEGLKIDASPHRFVGKGMRYFFSDLGGDVGLGDVAILKGLQQQGQHGIGNIALNQGGLSSYAKSFSSIVSQAIALSDYPRPLHYVSNATTPGALFLNTANTTGYEVPICIGDATAFGAFTKVSTFWGFPAFKGKSERLIEDAVSAMASALGERAKQKSSQLTAGGYAASYNAGNAISQSGWGSCSELQVIYYRYVGVMLKALKDLVGASPSVATAAPGFGAVVQVAIDGLNLLTTSQFKSDGDQLLTLVQQNPGLLAPGGVVAPAIAAQAAQLRKSIRDAIAAAYANHYGEVKGAELLGCGQGSANDEAVGQLAFSYALSEFLVRFDLSAVVDVRGSVQDTHYRWTLGLANVAATFAGLRELIRACKSITLADGTSLFEHTTIVLHTELDRYAYLENGSSSSQTGTNHGITASAIVAGMGIRGGTVVGGVSRGALEDAAFKQNGQPIGFGFPLPVNASGVPDPNGNYHSVLSLFPTVLAAFGIQVPLQQITEFNAISCAIKS